MQQQRQQRLARVGKAAVAAAFLLAVVDPQAHHAAGIFDQVLVAVAESPSKAPLFEVAERVALARDVLADIGNVEVRGYSGLTVEFARAQGYGVIVRGLRAVSDFEFEFQLALMNRKLNERVETIFMMPRETYTFVSSKLVKEIARLGGDISAFVPDNVEAALRGRLAERKQP